MWLLRCSAAVGGRSSLLVGWGRVRLVPASPFWRSRSPGSARPFQGPSHHGGSRACRGACPGLGGGRCRRRIPRPRRRPRVPSWTSRPAVGDGAGAWIRGRSGAPVPLKVRAPALLARPGSLVPGRLPRCRCPVGAGRPPICGSSRWWRKSRRSGPLGAPVLGVEEAPGLPRPKCRVGAARPSGRGASRLHGGSVGHRPLRVRAGPCGVSQVDGAGLAA